MKRRSAVLTIVLFLLLTAIVPVQAQEEPMRVLSKSSELQLLRQIEEDSGYDFSQNAKVRICTLNITQANKSKEIKQIAVEEMDASGNGSVLFIIPFQRNEENEL